MRLIRVKTPWEIRDRVQQMKDKGINPPLATNPMAYYAD
jgi:hypothetical protein